MSKRISSSDWTGPTDKTVRRGAFTHRIGDFGGTADYAWLNSKEPFTMAPPPELRGVLRLAAILLLSPLLLAAARIAGELGVRGTVISDASGYLLLWSCLIVGIALWQVVSRSLRAISLRILFLASFLVATVGIAIGYVIIAQRAYLGATAGESQRVLQYHAGSKRTLFGRSAIYRHQRADGTDLEGVSKRAPMPYGRCITVQTIKGEYGFEWLRLVEQMPPSRPGQLGWPVRREDCFSDKPLSTLAQ